MIWKPALAGASGSEIYFTICTLPVCRGFARNIGHELFASSALFVEVIASKNAVLAM